MAEINITPFTDVLLVLLIVFMILAALSTPPGFQKQVASPSLHRGFNGPLAMIPIVVSVTAANQITLDGKPATLAHLYQMMADAVTRHAERRQSIHVELIADAQTSYNAIIKILDAARQAGDDDIGFAVR